MWYLNGKPVGNMIVLNDRRIINPTEEQYLEAGCVWHDLVSPEQQQETAEEASIRAQEFAQACAQFKQICAQIQTAANLPGDRKSVV